MKVHKDRSKSPLPSQSLSSPVIGLCLQNTKRSGLLPLFLAQLLVLAGFVGFGASVTKYSTESTALVAKLTLEAQLLLTKLQSKVSK